MKLLAAPASVIGLKGAGRTRQLLVAAVVVTLGLVLMAPDEPGDVPAPAGAVKMRTRSGSLTRTAFSLPERSNGERVAVNAFDQHSWYVPPPPAPVVHRAPPKPVAPPLPFSYMGRFVEDGGKPVFYLVRGDNVYDVRVGDTLDNTYTVDAMENDQLVFTYKPLNERQALAIGR
jgi:hypothetical protein